jgi:hypothetical protein
LVAASLVITLIIVLLPLLDAMAIDPRVRLIVSLILLVVLALAMLRLALPKRKAESPIVVPRTQEQVGGDIEASARLLQSALDGNDYSKYLALRQLKDIAAGRIMLRLHLGREETEALMDDVRWLRHVLKDDALARIVAYDFRGTPRDRAARAAFGDVLDSFETQFPELLSKVEGLL